MRKARRLSRESGETAHLYGELHYAAKKWPCKRRLVVKAEVVQHPGREPKENPRFVVTNVPGSPRWIYERVYCGRGEIVEDDQEMLAQSERAASEIRALAAPPRRVHAREECGVRARMRSGPPRRVEAARPPARGGA